MAAREGTIHYVCLLRNSQVTLCSHVKCIGILRDLSFRIKNLHIEIKNRKKFHCKCSRHRLPQKGIKPPAILHQQHLSQEKVEFTKIKFFIRILFGSLMQTSTVFEQSRNYKKSFHMKRFFTRKTFEMKYTRKVPIAFAKTNFSDLSTLCDELY